MSNISNIYKRRTLKSPIMRKGSGTKTRISATIDDKLIEKLKKKLASRMIKVSNYIEHLIEEDLKNEK